MARRLRRDEYTVGWVCALPDEFTAAQEMLDEEHQDLPSNGNDANVYTLGCIGEHNVVLACLPAGLMGIAPAASVAMQMQATFPAIRFGLMVGIGGGVPSIEVDIRLGVVVVSQPGRGHGGVVQYDFGKATPSGFDRTGFLNAPPQILLAAVTKLRSNQDRGRNSLLPHLSKLSKLPRFAREKAGSDVLFKAEYNHVGRGSCASCAATGKVQREERTEATPVVHYGTIASGNQVIRDGGTRDKVSSEFGVVLCFEMEAAGLMNSFPCLVVRGICDYSDSHKSKRWQPYAAGTAAAYAKELLLVIPAADVVKTQTVDEATREQTPSFYLPFPRNRQFVGRGIELDALKQKLLINKDCQKAALVGLGGIGKTQIALDFAYFIRENCSDFSIFWMPVLSVEAFEQACVEVARALGIQEGQDSKKDIKKLVQQQLNAKTAGKWLLIIDNADDMSLLYGDGRAEGILDFLPDTENGLTLFTTRHKEVAQSLVGSDVLEVRKMGKEEAINLLKRLLVRKRPPSDDALVVSLLTELDYLPLAITQAAAYINTNQSSISEYLRLLKNTDLGASIIISTEFRDHTRYKNSANAIAKTWMITFNAILKRDKLAADLLSFISCIEWKAIPYSILPTTGPEALLANAIGTLCSYSFLEKRDDSKKFDMHRLVHLATRTWIYQSVREVETKRAVLKHVSEVFPSDEYTNREIWRDYLPHVARIQKDWQCQDTKEKREICRKVGRCLIIDGRTKEAVPWLQESCEWRDRNLAEDENDRLDSQHDLARAYLHNGRVKDAIQLLEHIVAIKNNILAEDHLSRLIPQHVLAQAYFDNGRIKDAIQLQEYIVTIQDNTLMENHSHRLDSQNELAATYLANGQIKEAIQLQEHVVRIRDNTLTEDHRDRLSSQHELARIYLANGQIKEVIKLQEHVVKIRNTTLTKDHPYRLTSQHGLARIYLANGQIKEAIKLQEHVVGTRHNTLAEDHPDRLASQHVLAEAYFANGQVKEALELLERVVAIRAEVRAEDHPNRPASEDLLASFYEVLSKRSETGQTFASSIEGSAPEDEDEDGRSAKRQRFLE